MAQRRGTVTELTTAVMGADEAQKITERIRLTLDTASRSLDRLAALVTDAYQRRADLALGYGSWQEYADAEFAEQTRDLSAPIRRELVGYLSASGMSTRAIAPAVGVSPRQAAYDKASGVQSLHTSEPDPTTLATVNMTTGEIVEPAPAASTPPPTPKPVTGLDGKTYTRPEPRAARPTRRPLPDVFADALHELDKRADALAALIDDDRFPANRDTIRLRCLAQANKTARTLAGVQAALETNSQKA